MPTSNSASIQTSSAGSNNFEIPGEVDFLDSVIYGEVDGINLVLEMARPKAPPAEPQPAVVFIHGGGWASADRTNGTPLILLLAQNGFVAVSIDYRLSSVAGYPAQLEDSKCAVRFLRAHAANYGVDPSRIGVMGGSAGGHLAALVGLTGDEKSLEGNGGWATYSSKVGAVANLYGVSDLPDLVKNRKLIPDVEILMRGNFQAKPDLYRDASPIHWVKSGAPPFYITHGDNDETVPFEQGRRLADALLAAGNEVTFRVMKGFGHGSIKELPDYVRQDVVSFFVKYLHQSDLSTSRVI